MNLREALIEATETIRTDELPASEVHCLLTEVLECPDPQNRCDECIVEEVVNGPVLL
jgi:hypothetical protein